MNVLRRIWGWITRWQMTLVLIAITVVFALGLRSVSDLRREDARIEREAALRFCKTDMDRTKVIREFLIAATAEPDPRQFEFIVDPTLRQGAYEQAKRGRAEMRAQVDSTFVLRDCAAEFPAPPNGG